jgi:hypothetical protein
LARGPPSVALISDFCIVHPYQHHFSDCPLINPSLSFTSWDAQDLERNYQLLTEADINLTEPNITKPNLTSCLDVSRAPEEEAVTDIAADEQQGLHSFIPQVPNPGIVISSSSEPSCPPELPSQPPYSGQEYTAPCFPPPAPENILRYAVQTV